MSYYLEIKEKIEHLIDQSDYQQALDLVKTELSMPYIPQDFISDLKNFEQICKAELNEGVSSALSFDVISDWLFDVDPIKVETALIALNEVNLRNYVNEIENLLVHHPDKLVNSMILLACMNQQIDYDFKFNKFGLDYEVNPLYVEHPLESDGYLLAKERLSDLSFKEPSLAELLSQLLVQEVIVALPNSYDELEGEMLAFSIYRQGLILLNRELEWYNFTVEHNLKEENCPTLFSTL